jgi:hypothetical protein
MNIYYLREPLCVVDRCNISSAPRMRARYLDGTLAYQQHVRTVATVLGLHVAQILQATIFLLQVSIDVNITGNNES